MKLMQWMLERADRMVSATWDLRRCALSYRLYIVTPRQGRHAVRRRLLRKLLREATGALDGGNHAGAGFFSRLTSRS